MVNNFWHIHVTTLDKGFYSLTGLYVFLGEGTWSLIVKIP